MSYPDIGFFTVGLAFGVGIVALIYLIATSGKPRPRKPLAQYEDLLSKIAEDD